MTGIRGDRSRGAFASVVCVCVGALLLAGCASAGDAVGAPPSASPTPIAACPQLEGVELPPECAPYDPERSMAENDRFRERTEISDESRAAADELIAAVTPALDALRSEGLSTDAVAAVLEGAGLVGIQTIGDSRAVAFGAGAPAGGCVFGEVRPESMSIEAGGVIMDGGCLPAQ